MIGPPRQSMCRSRTIDMPRARRKWRRHKTAAARDRECRTELMALRLTVGAPSASLIKTIVCSVAVLSHLDCAVLATGSWLVVSRGSHPLLFARECYSSRPCIELLICYRVMSCRRASMERRCPLVQERADVGWSSVRRESCQTKHLGLPTRRARQGPVIGLALQPIKLRQQGSRCHVVAPQHCAVHPSRAACLHLHRTIVTQNRGACLLIVSDHVSLLRS